MAKEEETGGVNNFSFNLSGNAKINQAAAKIENNNAHVGDVHNYGNQAPPPSVVMDKVSEIVQSIPEEELSVEEKERLQKEVIEPLKELAEKPKEEQKKPSVMERAKGLISHLTPYGPQIGQGLLAFGESALAAAATSHPVLGGLLAAVKVIKVAADNAVANSEKAKSEAAPQPGGEPATE